MYSTVASRLKRKFSSLSLIHYIEKCRTMDQIKQVHAQIIAQNLTHHNLTVGKLIGFCAVGDNGDLGYGQLVFDKVDERNRFMYNSLIRGYSNTDDPMKAVFLFKDMIDKGVSANEFTLPFVLKACGSLLLYWVVLVVHCYAVKLGINSQVYVQNGLIHVYVVCGFVSDARKVFDEISDRSLVSWNSMVAGYSKMGWCKDAFLLFNEMRELGLECDVFCLASLLSVCAQSGELCLGRFVHLYMVVTGVRIDLVLRNALLDMYAKCGDLDSARKVFDRIAEKNVVSWTSMVSAYAKHRFVESARETFDQMPVKNVVSWNSMISCYVKEGCWKEALDLFHRMCESGEAPDEATFVSILSACGQVGDLVMGKQVHDYILSKSITPSVAVSNALIDMYSKCGSLATAIDIFNQMSDKDTVSWNVAIAAFAMHGCGVKAVKLFEEMQASRIRPDKFTFMGLLSACSHSGLLDEGLHFFEQMTSFFAVSHQIEHYACMVDILGRGGLLEEAVRLIGRMPLKPDIVIWGALLGACRIHANIEIAKLVLKQILELEPNSSGIYTLLSNLFYESDRLQDVKNIRKLMNDSGIVKCKAISSLELDGHVYEFMVDEKRHENSDCIYTLLDQLTDHIRSAAYYLF